MRLFLAGAAEIDLSEIGSYIARDNPSRAISFVEELLAAMSKIPERPMTFSDRSEWKPGLRSAVHHGYHIVFQIRDDVVEVLRVLHGARDIAALF